MSTAMAEQVQKRSSQWQVPAFLLGLAALALVFFGRPLLHIADFQEVHRQLSVARGALKESPPALKKAQERTEAALNHSQQLPEHLGEVHYLAGRIYCRLAAQSSPNEVDAIWQKARFHLEEAAKVSVPESDGPRFLFDLGKARFHTGAPPQQVIDCLVRTVES